LQTLFRKRVIQNLLYPISKKYTLFQYKTDTQMRKNYLMRPLIYSLKKNSLKGDNQPFAGLFMPSTQLTREVR